MSPLALVGPMAMSRDSFARLFAIASMPQSGATASPPQMVVDGGTAYVPVRGVIGRDAASPLAQFGGSTVEQIRADLQTALADASVSQIVFDVDSPGGSIAGVDGLAAEIRAARSRKTIVANVDGQAGGSAFWLAVQAGRVVASRSSLIGGVDVIDGHVDPHRALMAQGLDPVVQRAQRVSDRAVQDDLHALLDVFVEAIAEGRGTSAAEVRAAADGSMLLATEALAAGLVDEVLGSGEQSSVAVRGVQAPRAAGVAGGTDAAQDQVGTWRAEFDASPALQAEFGSVETFVGWKRNELRATAARGPAGDDHPAPMQVAERARPTSTATGSPADWQREFAADPKLQSEFGSAELYVAWRRNEAIAGRSPAGLS